MVALNPVVDLLAYPSLELRSLEHNAGIAPNTDPARDAMVRAGNDCTQIEYEGAPHAFHYPGSGEHFPAVTETTSGFLESL